ncbi:FISUMP domain-containing protein [Butyricimonas paravirosa]
MMKTFFILFIFSVVFISCDKDSTIPVIQPEITGIFIDPRDSNTYPYVRYNGLEWMTRNLSYRSSEGFCHSYEITTALGGSTTDEILRQHGYLYDYTSAKTACPEGWRLPTDEDWKKLETTFGMSMQESNKIGWRGSCVGEILQQDESGSGIKLAADGFYSVSHSTYTSKYRQLGCSGLFWTSTADETKNEFAYYRKIAYNSQKCYRESTMMTNGLSVRCVREVD